MRLIFLIFHIFQVGKGPWASEVSGLVKIGQTMTMVLAIKDDDQKFDMLVRNCMAHDGKRAPIQLVDQKGCVTRPKLMSKFSKIKNFGASASVLSYAHFQAFKFPDSMEVHFQCTIQICRYVCFLKEMFFVLTIHIGLVFLVLRVRTSHSQTMNSQTRHFWATGFSGNPQASA